MGVAATGAATVDVEPCLCVGDRAADLAVVERDRQQRECPGFSKMVGHGPARVLVGNLSRPQDASHRERLRLHLVATMKNRAVQQRC
jgi:hypothetical protein